MKPEPKSSEQISAARTKFSQAAVVLRSVAPPRRAAEDPPLVRWTLTFLAISIITLLIIVPVANVFYQAFGDGIAAYWAALVDPPNLDAILTTLTVVPIAVLANTVFGVAAAWAIAKFQFPGRTFLITLIDLPFAVSPVVAGLIFMLLFGLQGYFGSWLREHDIDIVFALPGLVLATSFVTFPFVARELIPVMEAIGSDEELAALSLGANGWQMFWMITLPSIKWGLLYGLILCNARAMGEYGAVYVVSGRIIGETQTIPLRVNQLYENNQTTASFALASVLTMLALVTLVIKVGLERKKTAQLAQAARKDTHIP
jgi:sulfate transport system permease protein